MSALRVIGPQQPRAGRYTVDGFKHVIVPLIAASLAREGESAFFNVPEIEDVAVMCDILRDCGARVKRVDGTLYIDSRGTHLKAVLDPSLTKRVHGSLYFVPACAARFGTVEFEQSGGCAIGAHGGTRPHEHVISVMEAFGARCVGRGSRFLIAMPHVNGANIDIREYSASTEEVTGPFVSGATKTALLSAMRAKGKTTINFPYPKPDVSELVRFLKKCGHRIEAVPNGIAVWPGHDVGDLVEQRIVPDLTHVMTIATISVCFRVEMTVTGVDTHFVTTALTPEINALRQMGVQVESSGPKELRISPPPRLSPLHLRITSSGVYSDHQPFFALMLLTASGQSTIAEHVWINRFSYVDELRKLGARVEVSDGVARIVPAKLCASEIPLTAPDLRAAVVIILAALLASGVSTVDGLDHLRRGYPNFYALLESVGFRVEALADTAMAMPL